MSVPEILDMTNRVRVGGRIVGWPDPRRTPRVAPGPVSVKGRPAQTLKHNRRCDCAEILQKWPELRMPKTGLEPAQARLAQYDLNLPWVRGSLPAEGPSRIKPLFFDDGPVQGIHKCRMGFRVASPGNSGRNETR